MNLSDRAVSFLRTAIPVLWGWVVAQLLGRFTGLGDVLTDLGVDLTSPASIGFVTGVAVLVWYALWRWLEPRLPDWVTRVVLGAATAPAYVKPAEIGTLEDANIEILTDDERSLLADYRLVRGEDS